MCVYMQVLQANRIYDPALFDSLCDAGLHVLKTFVASGNTTPPTRRVRMEHMLPELHNNIASMGHVHTAMQSYVSEGMHTHTHTLSLSLRSHTQT